MARRSDQWWAAPLMLASWLATIGFAYANEIKLPDYVHTQWTQSQGLPSNTVHSIVQAAEGHLWIATSAGLARFDGFRMQGMGEADRQRFRQHPIQTLCVDTNDRLWIGASDGVYVHQNGLTVGMALEGLLSNDAVTAIACKNGRHIDLATQSGLVVSLDPFTGRRQFLTRLGQKISDIVRVDDDLYIATRFDGLQRCRVGRCRQVALPGLETLSLAWTSDSELLVGTQRDGVRAFSVDATGRLAEIRMPDLPSGAVWSVAGDLQTSLWLTVHGASVVRLQRQAGTWRVQQLPLAARVARLDQHGSLWVGTTERGLHRLAVPSTIAIAADSVLAESAVTAMLTQSNSDVVVGTLDSGVYVVGESVREVLAPNTELSKGVVGIFPDSEGTQLVLRHDSLVRLKAGAPVPLGLLEGVENQWFTINHVLFDTAHRQHWVARSNKRRHGRETLRISDPAQSGRVGYLEGAATSALDRAGRLWLAPLAGGLWVRDPELREVKYEQTELGTHVRQLLPSRDGGLWLSFYGGAVGRVRPEEVRVEPLSFPDLPQLSAVCGMLEAPEGTMYFGTNVGLLRVPAAEVSAIGSPMGARFDLFNQEDGMRSEACAGDVVWVPQDHAVWMATTHGIAALPRSGSVVSAPAPVLRLGRFAADDLTISARDASALPASTRRVALAFSANVLTRSGMARFRYRLKGGDERWTLQSQPGVIEFEGLAAGSYRIEVQSSRLGDGWQASPLHFDFRILQPFYRQPAFYIGSGFLGILVIVAAFTVRARWQRQRLRELERRATLARDLHDTIAQGFSGMLLRLQVARHLAAPEDQPLVEQLDIVASIARDSFEELRRVAADIRCSDSGQLPELLQCLRDAIGQQLKGTGISAEFAAAQEQIWLPSRALQEVLRIAQEAVSNAALHAGSRRLYVSVQRGPAGLCIEIRDFGVGIQLASADDQCNGIRGMHQRAQSLQGRLEITRADPGTLVRLTLPLPPSDTAGEPHGPDLSV